MQQSPRPIRARAARAQSLACRPKPFEPGLIFRAELRLEFLAKPLRERGTLAIGGDCDLQIAALNDSSVIKVAMLNVVHGVAQRSSRFGATKNGFVHAWGGSCRYHQKCIVQVPWFKFSWQPVDLSEAYPFGNLHGDGRRDEPKFCPSGQQAGNLCFRDMPAANDNNQPPFQLQENGKEAHGLSFNSLRDRAEGQIAIDRRDNISRKQRADIFVRMPRKKLPQIFARLASFVESSK